MVRLAAGFAEWRLPVTLVIQDDSDQAIDVPRSVKLQSLGVKRSLLALGRLSRLLGSERPAVLLSAFPHSNIVALAARQLSGTDCRVVISEHAPIRPQSARMGGWRYRLLPAAIRKTYRHSDAIVAVSEGVRDDLTAIDPRLRPRVIHNPVLASTWEARAAEGGGHPWLDDPTLEVVLTISRLSSEKDIPLLVKAFAAVVAERPNARLLIGGTGPQHALIAACVAAAGICGQVRLVGFVANPLSWMRRARVFALASRFEGFGNVLIEALAAGTRVVSTDCPVGPRELLQDGRYGSLVPVGDVGALSRAIVEALALGPGSMRHDHVAMAQCFTQERASAAYLSLFMSLGPCQAD